MSATIGRSAARHPRRRPTSTAPIAAANIPPPISRTSGVSWDYLEERHAGWEINDGAFGSFVFDVPCREITLEHNERHTDFTPSTDEF
jgi:hypothetical protein